MLFAFGENSLGGVIEAMEILPFTVRELYLLILVAVLVSLLVDAIHRV